ncbi:hypothetical protein CEN39_00770 [Fischerella thermalis CCMEE 5201]|jgi:hypothetical protein|nr:hypothetical protein CEN39_00770 [Fischerella thermalis CCMEE 5201]
MKNKPLSHKDTKNSIFLFTEERQRAGGSYAEGRNIFFSCQKGLKPLNSFMKSRESIYFETHSARNAVSLLNPLNTADFI